MALGDCESRRPSTRMSSTRGIGLRAQLAHGRAVHRDAAVEHQLLGRAARRDAGLRQNLLQPFHGNLRFQNSDLRLAVCTQMADPFAICESEILSLKSSDSSDCEQTSCHRHRRPFGRRQRHGRAGGRRSAGIPARRQRRDVSRGRLEGACATALPLDDEAAVARVADRVASSTSARDRVVDRRRRRHARDPHAGDRSRRGVGRAAAASPRDPRRAPARSSATTAAS